MSAACQNCHGDGMCGRRHGGECGCECHHVFSKEWNDKDKLRLCVEARAIGRDEARISCPSHPEAPWRRVGGYGVCSECGRTEMLCERPFGATLCIKRFGHHGRCMNLNGFSWDHEEPPQRGDTTMTNEDKADTKQDIYGRDPRWTAAIAKLERCRLREEAILAIVRGSIHATLPNDQVRNILLGQLQAVLDQIPLEP